MVVERGFHWFCDLLGVASKISMPSAPSGESNMIDNKSSDTALPTKR